MTAKIPRSAIADIDDFPARAAAYAVELSAWREHMAHVQGDAARGVVGIDRHIAHPRPLEHPAVMAAIDENSAVDFEIVEDGPTPDQQLAARKAQLVARVAEAEQAAIAAIVPAGKRRLYNMRENDIRTADERLAVKLAGRSRGLFAGKPKDGELPAMVDEQRPAEDTAFLREQDQRRQRIAAIERAAAEAQHDIEDLTAETIGDWQMPDFTEEATR